MPSISKTKSATRQNIRKKSVARQSVAKKSASRKHFSQKTASQGKLQRAGNLRLEDKGWTEIYNQIEALTPSLKRLGIEIAIDGKRKVLDIKTALATALGRSTSSEAKQNVAPPTSSFDSVDSGLQLVNRMKKAEGGYFTGKELSRFFSISSPSLYRRRKERRVVFWRDGNHEFYYPKWQFTESGALLGGVQEVLQIFKSSDEWRIMRYFFSARLQLDEKSPLELLRAGQTERVIEHARLHEAENSW